MGCSHASRISNPAEKRYFTPPGGLLTESSALLTLQGLARRFGPRWAVAGVSLEVQRGSTWMLTGPNGSGKSTLLRCLATALKPHQGQAQFEGRDLWTHRRELRHRIAYLGHQLHVWDDLSPRQNLQAWARMTGRPDHSVALLERVSLDPTRTDPVRALSAGMKRRLALARMLLKSPDLALLDEPFGALDPEGRQLVLSVIQDLQARGATVALATHLPDFAAELCSHHLALEGGHAVKVEAL